MNDAGARIIDTNTQMDKKMQKIVALRIADERQVDEMDGDFVSGIEAEQISTLLTDDEFGQVEPSVVIRNASTYDGPSETELMEKVQEEISALLEEAKAEAEEIKQKAKKDGFEQGKNEGLMNAQTEIKNQIETKQRELEQKEITLKKEYRKKEDEIEPLLVDTLTGIYEHIFKVKLKDMRGTILHLLSNTMRKLEGSRDFIIRISKEDYPHISMQKKQILGIVSGNSSVEIIEDMTLAEGSCMIETGGGLFDCSIDVELAELSKQLKILSFEKAEM